MATGLGHGALLKADGTVWTWGSNRFGQLGNGGDREATAEKPVRVPDLSGVKDVACGHYFTVVAKGDGTVWAWGDNSWGELGNGSIKPSNKPVQVPDLAGFTAVAAARRHALALKSDGTVWEWGVDSNGSRPQEVENLAGVVAVSDGDSHCVVLKSDGTVWVWGDHGAGDLGDGSYNNSAVPIRLGDLSDIAAVAAGYELTLALQKDGALLAVGYGAAGGLGDGTFENQSTRPVTVSGLAGVKGVAAGTMHVLAVKNDGTVWSWGDNGFGQLGNPGVGTGEKSANPVRSGKLSGIVTVAAASNHSVALADDGAVWVWGDNSEGALGPDNETLERSEVPMKIGESVPDKCTPLFSCGTGAGKVIQICGEQDQPDAGRGDKWNNIQYRYGPAYGPPELVFPKNPAKEASSLFFSHEEREGEYRVTVRFSSGGYTYRVYSNSSGEKEGGAGVTVSDSKGKQLADIACSERPEIYIHNLWKSLPCDRQNPHGTAACNEEPYKVK